jgi:hypothetical protein
LVVAIVKVVEVVVETAIRWFYMLAVIVVYLFQDFSMPGNELSAGSSLEASVANNTDMRYSQRCIYIFDCDVSSFSTLPYYAYENY